MLELIFEIACICAGILLAITTLDRLDGKSNFFNNIAAKLTPFAAIIGIVTMILGILFLLRFHCILFSITGILCGLLLLPQRLAKIPGIGEFLLKFSNAIQPYKVFIGDVALVLGILGVFNLNPFC